MGVQIFKREKESWPQPKRSDQLQYNFLSQVLKHIWCSVKESIDLNVNVSIVTQVANNVLNISSVQMLR